MKEAQIKQLKLKIKLLDVMLDERAKFKPFYNAKDYEEMKNLILEERKKLNEALNELLS
jgi:hypothetical protein